MLFQKPTIETTCSLLTADSTSSTTHRLALCTTHRPYSRQRSTGRDTPAPPARPPSYWWRLDDVGHGRYIYHVFNLGWRKSRWHFVVTPKQYYLDRVWFLIRIDGGEPIATVFIRIIRLECLERLERLERFGWRVRIIEKLNIDRVGYLNRTNR